MNDVFKTHGAVSWTELSTNAPTEAKAFYQTLFGWRFEDMPMAEGGSYAAIQVGDRQIGGIMQCPTSAGEHPPAWGSYVTVDDLDATLATAGENGGQTLFGPTEIPDVGRFALLQDPQGANLYVIEYLDSIRNA